MLDRQWFFKQLGCAQCECPGKLVVCRVGLVGKPRNFGAFLFKA
jgi:hypothetical protein